jgi:protein-L-isoaspartate(D-aspartate) O-methyltransferase
MSVAYFEGQRREMIAAIRVIAQHLAAEIGKTALDDRVLGAMAKVARHDFVPIEVQPYAYLNRPLPIGFDKTISQWHRVFSLRIAWNCSTKSCVT